MLAGVGQSVIWCYTEFNFDENIGIGLCCQYSSNGVGFISGNFEASISGSADAGIGLACDSECDGICEMDEWSGSVGLTLKGEMGYQDGNEYTETGIEDVYIEY